MTKKGGAIGGARLGLEIGKGGGGGSRERGWEGGGQSGEGVGGGGQSGSGGRGGCVMCWW